MIRRLVGIFCSTAVLCLGLLLLDTGSVIAGGGPRNVLVVQNRRSQLSQRIAHYYMQARQIPSENLCTIDCSTNECVDYTECEANIKNPIRAALENVLIKDRIDYIVLTKGIPLSAVYTDPIYGTSAYSVTSVLTCIDEPTITGIIINPYGPDVYPQVNEAFSHQTAYSGKYLYLVTRLDGYTEDEIYRMIDDSVSPNRDGYFALDKAVPTSNTTWNNRLTAANILLTAKAVPVIYDNTSTFLGNLTNLMGYFSWGSNDCNYIADNYHSNSFLPGSIADTYVSTSARTFNPTTGGQSLMADLISQGASGVGGFVSEPYSQSTRPEILFDKYTSGFNLAESFYSATPRLFWKHTVIGDPLMAPFAEKPYVAINSPETPITGVATISATAAATPGIAKVDFYFDNAYVGSATASPWEINVDTTQYVVGDHDVEAIAIDASPVAVQSSAPAVMTVQNPISNLSVVADAFGSPDGQGVRATAKVVTAVFTDSGGEQKEFYMQEEHGYSGIKVISSTQVNEGDLVNVVGELMEDESERAIMATEVNYVDCLMTMLRPVFMPNRSIGGGDFSRATKGVTNGFGLRNIGLLIKTSGKVTYVGSESEDFYYIDDGSGLSDGSGHAGIKINCINLCKPQIGMNMLVTGISSCENIDDKVMPVVRVRYQSDMQELTN